MTLTRLKNALHALTTTPARREKAIDELAAYVQQLERRIEHLERGE